MTMDLSDYHVCYLLETLKYVGAGTTAKLFITTHLIFLKILLNETSSKKKLRKVWYIFYHT